MGFVLHLSCLSTFEPTNKLFYYPIQTWHLMKSLKYATFWSSTTSSRFG